MGASTRWLLVLGGLFAANCLIWSVWLAICGGCVLSGLATQPSPPTMAAAQITRVRETSVPRLSPSPIPTRTPRPTRTPAPTIWIVNPTVSWPTTPRPSPTPTRPPFTPTPWPTQVIDGANAEAKTRSLMALAAQGPGIPFRVVFTEGEIEREIERYLAAQPDVSLRNVAVTFQPGEAVLAGQVKVSGLWLSATVRANAIARDGRAVVTVTKVDLGPFALPRSVEEELSRQLANALSKLDRLPFHFTGITLGTGRITIQGVTK